MSLIAPASAAELAEVVSTAFRTGTPLAVVGNATRPGLSRATQAADTLSTTRLNGITLYEPAELVIAAQAGTPIRVVEEALAEKGQRLAFEPVDHRPLYATTGEPTVGGVAATNASGPGRIAFGAARDAMIGLRFINGRGETLMSGGRVMKNVTGLDFVKALAGSAGTLGVFTEVFFKVQPKPPECRTLVFRHLDDARAVALMASALGSPFEPTGAAHWPADAREPARTCLRLEGFAESLAYRTARLAARLKDFGVPDIMGDTETAEFWAALRDGRGFFDQPGVVWRLSVPPSKGAEAGHALRHSGGIVVYDWGGGLIHARFDGARAHGREVHAIASRVGGHATLLRASAAEMAAAENEPPLPAGLKRLNAKLKASFDPAGVFGGGQP